MVKWINSPLFHMDLICSQCVWGSKSQFRYPVPVYSKRLLKVIQESWPHSWTPFAEKISNSKIINHFILQGGKYNIVQLIHNATKPCLELHFMKTHHVTKGFYRDSDGSPVYASVNVLPPIHTLRRITQHYRKTQVQPYWITPNSN